DVEGTRSPTLFPRAIAPECPLDALPPVEQRPWPEGGRDRETEIDERRLVFDAPRRSPVVRRARRQGHLVAVAERGDGRLESRARVADIAAECDQGVNHDGSAPG